MRGSLPKCLHCLILSHTVEHRNRYIIYESDNFLWWLWWWWCQTGWRVVIIYILWLWILWSNCISWPQRWCCRCELQSRYFGTNLDWILFEEGNLYWSNFNTLPKGISASWGSLQFRKIKFNSSIYVFRPKKQRRRYKSVVTSSLFSLTPKSPSLSLVTQCDSCKNFNTDIFLSFSHSQFTVRPHPLLSTRFDNEKVDKKSTKSKKSTQNLQNLKNYEHCRFSSGLNYHRRPNV